MLRLIVAVLCAMSSAISSNGFYSYLPSTYYFMRNNQSAKRFVGGSNLMMFKSAKNKDAAWELMKYMSQDDIQTQYAALMGMFPARLAPTRRTRPSEFPKANRKCVPEQRVFHRR